MTVLRAAYVKVKPDTDGFDSELKSRLRRIDASKEGDRTGRTFGKGMSKGFAGTSGTFSRVAATFAAKASLIGIGAASATPGLIQLTAALAPATGALVALPGALGAVQIASGTFKVATAGVGKAITSGLTGTAAQAKKSLEGLPPAARSFASVIVGLKPKIDALRQSVAQRFFLPLQDDIKPLVRLYFPLLRKQMADLAGPLGGLGEQIAESARKAGTFAAVQSIFRNTRVAVINVRGAIDPLTSALANLIKSTVPFLPGLALGFANIATQVGAFVSQAAKSGQIAEVFRNSVTTLKDLGGIVANVGSILHSVFAAATAGGNSLLANFRALTGQVAAFLKSGSGSTGLTSTFQALAALGQALRTTLGAVLPAIGQSVQKLAPAIVALAGPLAQLVVALAPLIPLAAGLAAQLLTKLTPAIAAFAGWLTENQDVLRNFAVAIGATVIAIKAYEIFVKAAAVATAIWSGVQTVAAAATKVWAAGQWLLNAALTANPIGIVIVAIGALVAGVILAYKHSETFRTIVQAAWQGIQVAVSFAWNNVIKPVVIALVSFFRDVIAPTAMYLYNNVFRPAFTGIGYVVHAAWVVIQIALAAFRLYLTNVVFPVVRFLYANVIKPVFAAIGTVISLWWNGYAKPVFSLAKAGFSALGAAISAVWSRVIKPVFQALGGFLTGTVAPAFKKGVDAIRGAWEKVKDAAKVPVSFVVNKVINPLVGGINAVAKFVGVKDQIPKIAGFATGGQIPGAPSFKDNRLATGPGGLLRVATGEFITNTKSTMANLPLVKAINAKQGKVTRDDVDPYLDGFRRGGMIGDGIGGFFSDLVKGAKGAASAVLHPKEALTKVANAALARIPGAGAMVDVVKGMGRRVIQGVGSFVGDKLGGGGIGGASVLGGWRGMQRLIAGRFPGLSLISGFRPGARTLSGAQSYHALGRAVDYPPVRALAAWIKSTFGAKTKELITPWQELNLHNGKPHTYTGAIWNQHNFAGGNAHVHWAARRGGLIGPRSGGLPLFDNGGTLSPGVNTVYNGLGRPEPLVPARGGDLHVHIHDSVITSERQAVDLFTRAYKIAKKERKIP